MPTNVMVNLSSGMAGWGLGDCQAAPSVGRNGGQVAGISDLLVGNMHEFSLSDHRESTPAAAPLLTNPSLLFQHKVCLKQLVLPWQCLPPPSSLLAGLQRHTKSCLSYQTNRIL